MNRTRSRFATALQKARLDAHLTQERLVELLHVNQRTAISWETGERIPSIGIVFLLCMVLAGESATSSEMFSPELVIPYLLDDLERQKRFHQEAGFQELAAQGMQKLLQIAASLQEVAPAPQALSLFPEQKEARHETDPGGTSPIGQREAENTGVEQLFTLIERLRNRPDLIPVVNEFLDQVLLV